jgi:hypothetical protein
VGALFTVAPRRSCSKAASCAHDSRVSGTLCDGCAAAQFGSAPVLTFQARRAWQLQVYVNDEKVLDMLMEGLSDSPSWRDINVDLSKYANQEVVLRLYQSVLISHHEAANAYWQHLGVN